jgi:ribosomal protein L1
MINGSELGNVVLKPRPVPNSSSDNLPRVVQTVKKAKVEFIWEFIPWEEIHAIQTPIQMRHIPQNIGCLVLVRKLTNNFSQVFMFRISA